MESKSIVLIGLCVLVAILVTVSFSLLNSLSGYHPIAFVTFPSNTVLDIQRAEIYPTNTYGVYPSDKLLLQLTVSKNIPDLVAIKPLIYTTVGGIPVSKSEDQKWQPLEATQPQTFSYEFYAGTEGQNIVNVDINTTNPTEKVKFVVFINGTSSSFDILSPSDRLLSNQNTMILIGIVVSGVGSGIALSLTAYQAKLSRDEKNENMRAWIGNADSQILLSRVFNASGSVLSKQHWEKLDLPSRSAFNLTEAEYQLKIKNFGSVPATNAKGRTMVVFGEKPDRTEISEASFGFPFILFPDQEQLYMFKMNRKTLDEIELHRNKAYFVNEFVYNSGDTRQERKFGFIAELSTGGFLLLDSWDEKSFSKKTKISWKERFLARFRYNKTNAEDTSKTD